MSWLNFIRQTAQKMTTPTYTPPPLTAFFALLLLVVADASRPETAFVRRDTMQTNGSAHHFNQEIHLSSQPLGQLRAASGGPPPPTSWRRTAPRRLTDPCSDAAGVVAHVGGHALTCGDVQQHCPKYTFLRESCPVACGSCLPTGWSKSALERRALEALYESAGGSGWVFSGGRPNNWVESPCHCQWAGISCRSTSACSDSPVVKIRLLGALASYGLNASGTLPGSVLAELTELQFLGIAGNPRLSGTLPTEAWTNLTKMRDLYLNGNSLSGTLPDGCAAVADIRMLRLDSNHLSGSLPETWAIMTDVLLLALHSNQLSGTLPEAWATMNDMQKLSLGSNHLSGTLPEAWANQTDMRVLGLHSNHLSGSLPEAWAAMSNMRMLDLYLNQLSGTLPEAWAAMNKTQKLSLDSNSLSGSLPEAWATMTSMKALYLYSNLLSGLLPGAWATMTEMQMLSMRSNALSGSLPEAWGTMTKMHALYLYSNAVSGTLPEAWAKMIEIQKLYLYSNHLSGALPEAWASMTKMQKISLYSNQLRGSLPKAWANLNRMMDLYLYANQLSGSLPGSWAAMVDIQKLSLHSNRLRGSLPDSWGNMTQVDTLGLNSNYLSGSLPARTWAAMTAMQTLDLSSNRLSGSLPEDWGTMTKMRNLDISSNELKGSLPSHWSAFANTIRQLSLKGNKLDGTLPPSWAQMSRLRQLYLNNNQLHGSIPDVWGTNLTELQVFAAQQNNLGGTIPEALLAGEKRCIVLLNDNQFRGRITRLSPGFFRSNCTVSDNNTVSSWFRPSLLLQNNRLSCTVPEAPSSAGGEGGQGGPYTKCTVDQPPLPEGNIAGDPNLTHAFNSLLLPGNRFEGTLNGDGSLPSWVYGEAHGDPTARAAPLLYLHRDEWWRVLDSFTELVLYLLVGLVAVAAATFRIKWCRRHRLLTEGTGSTVLESIVAEGGARDQTPSADSTQQGAAHFINVTARAAKPGTDRVLVVGIAVLTACAVLSGAPAYVAGAYYYECGDAAIKVTSAYLADSPGAEAAACASLIATALASVGTAAALCVTATTLDAGGMAESTAPSSPPSPTIDGDGPAASSPATAGPSIAVIACTRRLMVIIVWFVSVVVLSVPTFLYSMTSSVPIDDSIFDNTVFDFFHSESASADVWIHRAAPILLTLINAAMIPPLVRWCSAHSGWPSSWLLLASRLLTTWVVPTAAVVVFSNSCNKSWLLLWNKCNDPRELDVIGPSGGYEGVIGSVCTRDSTSIYYKGYIEHETLVSGTTTCSLPPTTVVAGINRVGRHPQQNRQSVDQLGRCGRAVIETLAPLLVNKMALSVFLLPAVTIVRWRLLPLGVGAAIMHPFRHCRRRPGQFQQNDAMAAVAATTESKKLSLDNLMAQHLTWFDLAIVFGPQIPLLLPLTLATLAMSHWTHRLGIQAFGMVEARADHARLSTWYVLMGVFMQQALSAVVFAGAQLTGWQAVVATGVVVCACCVGLALVPAAWLRSMQAKCGRSMIPCKCSVCGAWLTNRVVGQATGRPRGVGSIVEMRLGDGGGESNRDPLLGRRENHDERLGHDQEGARPLHPDVRPPSSSTKTTTVTRAIMSVMLLGVVVRGADDRTATRTALRSPTAVERRSTSIRLESQVFEEENGRSTIGRVPYLGSSHTQTRPSLLERHPGAKRTLAMGVEHPRWNSGAAERRALEALYESAGGPGWVFSRSRENNWAKGECHCQWTDVLCMDRSSCTDSPVVALQFNGAFADYGINASGTLPGSEIAGLLHLRYLWLSGNPLLSGTLPGEAWKPMTEIQTLCLRANQLSGPLPEAWASMTKLQDLELNSNHLSGSLPGAWATLTELQTLALQLNRLSGTLPAKAWSNMIQMRGLDLHSNNLSGLLPAAWMSMAEIQQLNVHANHLSGSLPEAWANITKVQQLFLLSNHLSGTLPKAWAKMKELQVLSLPFNNLSGSLPEAWAEMTKLLELDLQENVLNGSLPENWAALTEMDTLQLYSNGLSGTLPEGWAAMTKMAQLALDSNRLSGSVPKAWASMANMQQLDSFSNHLSGSLPASWAAMTQIKSLDLHSNKLSGALPEDWAKMTQIVALSLSSNRLSGALPTAWASMTEMQYFQLLTNNLSGTLPKAWANMTEMLVLLLCSNHLSGALPETWANMTKIQIFDLHSNALSGPLPPQWATLADSITQLSLKGNKLDGTLPPGWAQMSRLRQLYLNNNQLHGSIPDVWGTNLTELQVFAAQQNNLGGTIPEALLAGEKRCIVLLNDNQFRGRITRLSPGFFRSNCTVSDGLLSSSWFRPSLLLQNNRLSCGLPRAPSSASTAGQGRKPYTTCDVDQPPLPEGDIAGNPNLTHAFNSLLLPGNSFEGTLNGNGSLPSWVYGATYGDPTARAAPLLYLHRGEWWRVIDSFTVPALYLLAGLLTLAVATFRIRWCRQRRSSLDARTLGSTRSTYAGDSAEESGSGDVGHSCRTSAASTARADINQVLVIGIAILLVCAVFGGTPAYFTGANYYECGDIAIKVTSAYLADSPGSEAAASASLITAALVSLGIATALRAVTSNSRLAASPSTTSTAGDVIILDSLVSSTGPLSVTTPIPWIKKLMVAAVWLMSLTFLSGPSFIYSMTKSVPTDDSIFNKTLYNVFHSETATADLVEGVSRAAPVLLTLINAAVIPPVVKWCSAQSGWPSSWLLLVSRLLTTWVVPIAAIVAFSNGCGKGWLRLWNKCSSPRDLDVVGPSGGYKDVLSDICRTQYYPDGRSSTFNKGYAEFETLVHGAAICNLQPTLVAAGEPNKNGYQQVGQCGRAVIETLSPLLINKMALSVFLLPAVTILQWRLLPLGVGATIKSLFTRSWRRSSRAQSVSRQEEDTPIKVKRLKLDNLMAQHLTWFDLAIVFGPHIPLLLPLILVTLVMSHWTHRLGIQSFGMVEVHAEQARLSTWYVLMSVMTQQALSAFVFAGARLTGWQAVVATGAAVCVGCVGLAVVPAARLRSVGAMCGSCLQRRVRQCQCHPPRRRQHRLSSAAVMDPAEIGGNFTGQKIYGCTTTGEGGSRAARRDLHEPLLSQN